MNIIIVLFGIIISNNLSKVSGFEIRSAKHLVDTNKNSFNNSTFITSEYEDQKKRDEKCK